MNNYRLIGRTAFVMAGALSIVACAGSVTPNSAEDQKQRCSVGAKLVCEERHGHVVRCSCKSDEDIRDILDPSVYE
jgi:hypothetical protein